MSKHKSVRITFSSFLFLSLILLCSLSATADRSSRVSSDPRNGLVPFAGGISVAQFNAKCDGEHDDSNAFRAASAASKVIVVPAGTCVINGFVPQQDTALIGQGRDQSIIVDKPGSTSYMIAASTNLYIYGLTLDGNQANQQARHDILRFSGKFASLYVFNCRFRNSGASAVFGADIDNLFSVTNSEFRDVSLSVGSGRQPYPNTSTAIYVSTSNGGNLVIHDNWFINSPPELKTNAPAGVQIQGDYRKISGASIQAGTRRLTISQANFTQDDTGKLIAIAGAGPSSSQLQTIVSRVIDSEHVLLESKASSSVTAANASWTTANTTVDISNNEFRYFGNANNTSGAIEVYQFTNRTVISHNRAFGAGYSCFEAANSNATEIVGNLCSDSASGVSAPAIFYSGGARNYDIYNYDDVVISDNIVRNWPSGAGISVAGRLAAQPNGTRRLIISRNIVDSAKSGIQLDGVGQVLLDNNIIDHSTGSTTPDAGIYISNCSDYTSISGGAITNGASYGIASDLGNVSCDFSIQNVRFENNAIAQVLITDAKSVQLATNQFSGSAIPFQLGVGQLIKAAYIFDNAVDGNAANSVLNAVQVNHAGNSFDVLSVSGEYSSGPILDNHQVAVEMPLKGASVGDFVEVSFDSDLSGLQLTAYVAENDKVVALFRNQTGKTVTPVGHIFIKVNKRRIFT